MRHRIHADRLSECECGVLCGAQKRFYVIQTHFRLMAAVHIVIDVYSMPSYRNDTVCAGGWHRRAAHRLDGGINASITYCFVIFKILLLIFVPRLPPSEHTARVLN